MACCEASEHALLAGHVEQFRRHGEATLPARLPLHWVPTEWQMSDVPYQADVPQTMVEADERGRVQNPLALQQQVKGKAPSQ